MRSALIRLFSLLCVIGGGSSKTDPGNTEALGEFDAMGSPMSPNRAKPMGGIDLQIQNTQTDYANEMGQSPLESTAPLGSLKIPKPPRQSTAELRAAIQGRFWNRKYVNIYMRLAV